MKKTRFLLSMSVLALLLIFSIQVVLAATSRWNGSVGGVGASATKTLDLGRYGWTTYLYSRADQNINIIGMTYWTLEEVCTQTGRYAFYKRYGGAYDTNDNYFSRSAYILYQGCEGEGLSRHKNHGNHDFAYGSEHKYPYVAVTVYR